jgi:hypothetical protein
MYIYSNDAFLFFFLWGGGRGGGRGGWWRPIGPLLQKGDFSKQAKITLGLRVKLVIFLTSPLPGATQQEVAIIPSFGSSR